MIPEPYGFDRPVPCSLPGHVHGCAGLAGGDHEFLPTRRVREVLTFWSLILIVAAMTWLAVGMGASTISQIFLGHF